MDKFFKKNVSNYFLATTALENFWDKSRPILFLGEWCLPYKKKDLLLKDSINKIMPYVWLDKMEFKKDQDYLFELNGIVLQHLARSLNRVHGFNYSIRFWRILIWPWLNLYLGALFHGYKNIVSALKLYPDLETLVLDERDFVTPNNTSEFSEVISSDFYNLKIYSSIFKFLGKNYPSRRIENKFISFKKKTIKSYIKKILFGLSNFFFISFCNKKSVILFQSYIPRFKVIKLFFLSKCKIVPLEAIDIKFPFTKIDIGRRKNFIDISNARNEFERMLYTIIGLDIPKCYIENLSFIDSNVKSKFPKKFASIASSGGWFVAEDFKYWGAKASERERKLFAIQHGGNFGVFNYNMSDYNHLLSYDYFCTWGWNRDEIYAKTLALPVNKLIATKDFIASNKLDGILWVTTIASRYTTCFSYDDISQNLLTYYDWQAKFYKALSRDIKPFIKVRVRPEDFGWDVLERIKALDENIKIESALWKIGNVKGSFLQSLGKAKIFVCDHLSTTYLEALTLNKPTLLFWNPDFYDLNNEAKLYFDLLFQAGILHKKPEDAASVLNRVYADVEGWWNDSLRQFWRREFCYKYARRSSSSLLEWKEALLKND